MKHGIRRALVVALAAVTLPLLACASAGAFSLTGVTVTPTTPSGPLPPSGPAAAGAHPNMVIQLDFSDAGTGNADSPEGYAMHLAPGIVSYVNHVERCSTAAFGPTSGTASTCPAGSVVGSVVTNVTAFAGVNVPLPPLPGTIYNIDPPAGFPAALGIDINTGIPGEDVKLVAVISVDPHDLGLTATLHGLPNRVDVPPLGGVVPAHIDRITQTLFGYANGGQSFFTNPTSCIAAPITVTAVSHANATSTNSDSYTPVDCAGVPFSTSLTIGANPPITDSPSEISADVKPGLSDIPRVNSHVRNDVVTLPPGVLINPALAARLDACTDAQFAQSDTSVPATCPPSSAVGDITFVSPILGAFPGKAYFGTQTPTDRLRLFLDVPLYGAHIKISAHVHPDFTTGQITTVFDELPQIAFTDFQLTFHGGPQSALVTPTTCGTHTATATVYPWSGTPPVTTTASFNTVYDLSGGPCRFVFKPSVSASVSDHRAGHTTAFTLVFDRPDRNAPVGKVRFFLPAGLTANLALKGLTQCALDVAAAGNCPASSRLGGVKAIAGSGSEPPTLPGDVYLTKPKVKGDPAGLSIKVPAKLGPVDAGTVIVGTRVQLRGNGGLTITSDDIPALQQGIPLALRQLTVTIDRPGFMRNPTSCGTQRVLGSFFALGGGHAGASTSFTTTDCQALRFAPTISVALGGRGAVRAGSHPPLRTLVRQRVGEAGIKRVYAVLPRTLGANLLPVNAACKPADFAAGKCSSRALVARASARSPLVAVPLSGPVYYVSQGTGRLPKLVVTLNGPLTVQFNAYIKIGANGQLATTFKAPDLPLTSFQLVFHGGRYAALTAAQNLCAKHKRMRASFRGYNGKGLTRRPVMKVSGCPRPHHRRR
jgi:hypothetical protein